MKKPQRRLSVRVETIRLLSSSQLERAIGGTEEVDGTAEAGDITAPFGPKTRAATCMDTGPRTNKGCFPILEEIAKTLSLKCK